jgi:hypothetical protein
MHSSRILSTYTITIDNQSNNMLENIFFSEQGYIYQIDPVPSHSKRIIELQFQSEGSVNYSFTQNGIVYTDVLFGYITNGTQGTANITMTQYNQVEKDSNTTFM